VTTPNPPDTGSGEVVAAPLRWPAPGPLLWGSAKPSRGDRMFRGLSEGSGVLIVVLVAAVGLFLLMRAVPALARNQVNFFTYGGNWDTANTAAMRFGVFDLVQVTVMVALFALVLAMPVALGIAIFLSQYSPRRVTGPLAYVVDLLAAVPSIIYGVWGLFVLAPQLRPIATWLNAHLGGVFLFATGNVSVSGGGTIFTAGIVLAVMILPIITAVTRAVLPFGRSGYISGAMLGLGRALGETIALLIILRGTQVAFGWSLFDGGYTFATKIAATAYEFNDQYKAGAYIAAGLVLFVLTLVVNAMARATVAGKGTR
jgi:phosphate transport system permease protein